VVAFLLVALVNCDATAKRLFSNPLLVTIGVASYSIYLIHEPLIAMLEHVSVFPPLAFAVALGIGLAFWWIVERPLTGSLRRPLVARVHAVIAAAWHPSPAAAKTYGIMSPPPVTGEGSNSTA
jgi:peptidoglycan/LPS O-acetylase OafA/YrhL